MKTNCLINVFLKKVIAIVLLAGIAVLSTKLGLNQKAYAAVSSRKNGFSVTYPDGINNPYRGKFLLISRSGEYTVGMYDDGRKPTDHIIVINTGKSCNITLNLQGVNINSTTPNSPIIVNGTGTLTIVLSGTNTLKSKAKQCPAVNLPDGAKLILREVEAGDAENSLDCASGSEAAGIYSRSDITVYGGTVTSHGGKDAIRVNTLTVNDGTVEAISDGENGDGVYAVDTIDVNGGTIYACATGNGNGMHAGTRVHVTAGTVTAIALEPGYYPICDEDWGNFYCGCSSPSIIIDGGSCYFRTSEKHHSVSSTPRNSDDAALKPLILLDPDESSEAVVDGTTFAFGESHPDDDCRYLWVRADEVNNVTMGNREYTDLMRGGQFLRCYSLALDDIEDLCYVGGYYDCSCMDLPQNAGRVTFTSTDPTVARVTNDGSVITFVRPGEVTITATMAATNTRCTVSVSETITVVNRITIDTEFENAGCTRSL